ncbi:MAG: M60 family metallopeptidase, partial [Turicibacter sp.]
MTDWDTGAVYGANRGSIITFDETYTIGSVAFAQTMEKGYSGSTNNVKVTYWTEDGTQHVVFASQLTSKVSNTHRYYVAQLPEPIEAKKIKVDTSGFGNQTMSELKFYEYSSLEDEVAALFADDLRVKLSEVATLEVIEALMVRANTPDEVSGDDHPNKATLLKELELAKALLLDANLSEVIVSLDATLRDNGGAIGISNAWQSLGAVARPSTDAAGESKSIVVYMGSSDANTQVEVTFLQTFGQPGQYMKGSTVIKPGRTEIVIPEIFTADVEKGGAVMAKVRSGSTDATIQIRLSNIDEIPHLNVNQLDEVEMKVAIGTYLNELEAYVAKLPTLYPDSVSETDKLNNVYPYDAQTSVLNSTDIEGNRFTLTVPATQILKSIQSGLSTKEAQIERIYQALMAWEQELLVTYAKKGVFESVQDFNGNGEIDESDNAYYQKHKAPVTRLNVKYQRMVMGAAAYASSHHVGVGYGETLNFMRGIPYVFDESNQVINGDTAKLYGALMGHEIGHVVDIKNRTYAETSNNLLASITDTMLNQDNSKTAGSMTELYKKVTSHTYGLSTNRSVVLGMLWQPHLAYENESTYKMLITNFDGDLTNDSYFAKLNRAYREMSAEEIADGDRDQWLIRLSSKVVGKDLSDFYEAHGLVSNQTTLAYVSQFEKETRPIQYLNDEARRMRLARTSA